MRPSRDSDGTIHACYVEHYSRTLPMFRIVDPIDPNSRPCREPRETALSWNQQGPDGRYGACGATGAPRATRGTEAMQARRRGTVVAQARSTGPVTAAAQPSFTAVPLSGNSWTQGASESDLFMIEVDRTGPANCGGSAFGVVEVLVDGSVVGSMAFGLPPVFVGSGPTRGLGEPLFETGASGARTISARAQDHCSTEHFTINSVKVKVVGFD